MTADSKQQTINHLLEDLDQLIHSPARLRILTYLYVVSSADYVFLKNQTGLSWGNLSTHLYKLQEAGYVEVQKGYDGKKPQTTITLTKDGREAFDHYKRSMRQVLDDLPD
jgi:DNA-binding MarR family transcriptional regulator